MAAAAGNESTTSLSLLMEGYGLEVEEELSTMDFVGRSLDRKMASRTKRNVDEANSRSSDVETV